jgi:hypothetical protein
MKIAALSATALALAAATAVATPSYARDYGYYDSCSAKKQDAGTKGAVIGGLAGALLGSSLAGHGDKTGGLAIGAVAGALVGNSIARSDAKDSRTCQARDYRRASWRGYADEGRRADYRPHRYDGYRSYGAYQSYGY